MDKEVRDFGEAWDILSAHNADDILPKWSNGHDLISDYGLPLILKITDEMIGETNVCKLLVSISKILNITHPRSDLAELFIIGGSSALDEISN